jgi:hypothetical protein
MAHIIFFAMPNDKLPSIHIHTTKKIEETQLDASKKASLGPNTEKTKHMFMYLLQNAEPIRKD